MRENNFYQTLIMFLFVTCYVVCFMLASRTIEFGGLVATAGALIYPFTYFIAVLFYERYGKDKTFELINFSVISLIFAGLVISLASTFVVHGGSDGLEKLFNIDYRVLFSCIVGFLVGQYVNIKLYDFLGGKKGTDFLVAGVIAITIDSFLFIGLSFIGVVSLSEVLSLATGQYVMGVVAILIYAMCFNALMPSLMIAKKKSEKKTTTKKEVNKK